jgi:large subunit ribosomal protein L10
MAFKAGFIEGVYYNAEGMAIIANIPGREVLIAKFLGSIQSPVSKLVRTFQAIADAKA